jgi:hypothetical protein
VAVESAVYGVVCGASAVFVVGFPQLGVFLGGSSVDSVVGAECVSGCRYVGQVGFLLPATDIVSTGLTHSRYEVPIVGPIASRILDDE